MRSPFNSETHRPFWTDDHIVRDTDRRATPATLMSCKNPHYHSGKPAPPMEGESKREVMGELSD
jgi:hypothetical protein